MKRFFKYVGAAVLVTLSLAVLIWLLAVFMPSPTPEERAAFERWQADQVNRASETGGVKKK